MCGVFTVEPQHFRTGGEEPHGASLTSVGRLQHVLELSVEVVAVVETDEDEQQVLGLGLTLEHALSSPTVVSSADLKEEQQGLESRLRAEHASCWPLQVSGIACIERSRLEVEQPFCVSAGTDSIGVRHSKKAVRFPAFDCRDTLLGPKPLSIIPEIVQACGWGSVKQLSK